MPNTKKNYILTATCQDASGISATVANFIYENSGFITSSYNYGDPITKKFFLRIVFNFTGHKAGNIEEVKTKFPIIAKKYSMKWELNDCDDHPRVMLAVSKFGHCLNDLLHKTKSGQIPMEIAAVVSNHPDMKELVEWYGIDFHYLPVDPDKKEEQEKAFLKIVEKSKIDLIVLARYMQILSPQMCKALKGRCINIHHSFLPGFKGAAPYKQAYERGVKIVGATAHYVTPDLDEGPIIEQAVERIDHTSTVDVIAMTVRDLETVTLSRAVKWHVERRILLNGNKTVVFK